MGTEYPRHRISDLSSRSAWCGTRCTVPMAASRDALVRKRARIEPPFPSEETEEEEQCSPKMAAVSRIALVMCGSFSPVTNLHLRMFGGFVINKPKRARGSIAV